nr:hypothetical protein [Aminivibrio sp.]
LNSQILIAKDPAAPFGQVQDLDEEKSQVSHGETARETAVMISFLTEVIGIRDDMYIGEGNRYMREFSSAVGEAFDEGILPRRPNIVNLQCDLDHPTQSMADLCWLREHFGSLDALQGKKIAMTWAYSPSYGKPLSVPQGILGLMTRFGMNEPEMGAIADLIKQVLIEGKYLKEEVKEFRKGFAHVFYSFDEKDETALV